MADTNRDTTTGTAQPNPNNGDVLGAMRAQQANQAALYQLQQVQNQNLESISALQEFANGELKKQTKLLDTFYKYMLRRFGNPVNSAANRPVNTSSDNLRSGSSLKLENVSEIDAKIQQANLEIQGAQQVDIRAATVNLQGADQNNAGPATSTIQDALLDIQSADEIDIKATTVNLTGTINNNSTSPDASSGANIPGPLAPANQSQNVDTLNADVHQGQVILQQGQIPPPPPPPPPPPQINSPTPTQTNNAPNIQSVLDTLTPYLHMQEDMVASTRSQQSALERYIRGLNQSFQQQVIDQGNTLISAAPLDLGTDWGTAESAYHLENLNKELFESLQNNLGEQLRTAFNISLNNTDLQQLQGMDFAAAGNQFNLNGMSEDSFDQLQQALEDVPSMLEQSLQYLNGGPLRQVTALDAVAQGNAADIEKVGKISDFLNKALSGDNWGSASGTISAAGDLAGSAAGAAVTGVASTALTAALTPVLGPLAPIVGEVGGEIVGKQLEKTVIAGFKALADYVGSIEKLGRASRDKIIDAGFNKIRQDVTDMATYSIDTYQSAVSQIYSSWDKNIGAVTATMGYTKEAVNSLQDSVAQRLQSEGYGESINAANYLDELGSVLNANLNGELAEIFATQSLILEKAVPEIDMTSMAAQFAAIYTNAEKEGSSGEQQMTEAMNQIAGAIKAIEKTTDGNNQFIRQVPAYLQQAQEIVARAGGSVDQVASLTTEMMAAEGPLASLSPQLSGFTGQLVTLLTDQNNSTAVALRAIMHDINSDIGVSATDFMNSFMDDTKGTLVTAFQAINEFIEKNENPGARQEFYESMETLFGVQSSALAQIDFGYIGDQLAQTNASLNSSALSEAEALVKSGETATLEEQLVDNTANMLLAQNAVRDTLDNAIMRKLEQNELQMERLVYTENAVQSVNLAEDTMSFFTKVKDIIVDLLDPFGLFKTVNSLISASVSKSIDDANYKQISTLSSIGSSVADDTAGDAYTKANTKGGAHAVIAAAELTDGNALATQHAVENSGVAGSTQSMLARHAMEAMTNQQLAAEARLQAQSEAAIGNYQNTVENQNKEAERARQEAEHEQARQKAAEENQARMAEEEQRNIDNHDNLASVSTEFPLIKDEVVNMENAYASGNASTNETINGRADTFTELYIEKTTGIDERLQQIQDEGLQSVVSAIYETETDVSKLDDIQEGVDRIITLFSTYLEILDNSMRESTGSGLKMSPSDRAQILGKGLLT